jgi:hypothetical protein
LDEDKMAYQTGTVTGMYNLLTALRDFLTTNATLVSLNQNWVVEKEEDVAPYTRFSGISAAYYNQMEDFHDLYLRAPGFEQQNQIYVNICTMESSYHGFRNWAVVGATDFETGQSFENQPNISLLGTGYPPVAILSNAEIQYWLVANGRRFILVYEIEGDFFCIHGGFILPYAKPSEFSYPLLVTGQSDYFYNTPATAGLHNFYRHAPNYASQFRFPEGVWYKVSSTTSAGVSCWPFAHSTSINNLQQNPDNSFTLLPVIMLTYLNSKNTFGEVQGLFFVCKRGATDLASEDTITISGSTYLVFQDVDDQGDNSYCCLLLE